MLNRDFRLAPTPNVLQTRSSSWFESEGDSPAAMSRNTLLIFERRQSSPDRKIGLGKRSDCHRSQLLWTGVGGLPTRSTGAGITPKYPACGLVDNHVNSIGGSGSPPWSSGFNDGVKDEQKAAHGRHHRNLVQLAARNKMLVVGAHNWIPNDRGRSGAVQYPPERRASSANHAPPAQLAAVLMIRRNTHQRGGFGTVKRAQLRQPGQQRGAQPRAHARHAVE
jgi:hypothetical protein